MVGKPDMMHYLPEVNEADIDAVLAKWQARYPKLGVCVLLPEAEKERVALLQAACARRKVALAGGIFPALIREGEFCSNGAWLLFFPEMPYFALHDKLPSDAVCAAHVAKEIAAGIRVHLDDTPDLTLFMMFDAMVPNISTLLDNLYLHLANRVHYAGGNAGSETFQPMPCLFDSQRVAQNAVLLMLLKHHHGTILEHGYRAPDHSVYATSTMGNRISQIDWRPAFEVYQELVRAQYGVEITPQNFYQHAVHFPFGIVRADYQVVVRIPVRLAEDGSLFCIGEVPSNAVLTLLEKPAVDSNETLRVLTEGLASLNGDPNGAELLLFYCAGRRLHMGLAAATAELREFADLTRAVCIAGALSLGEIGGSSVHGYPLFHNAALGASYWYKGQDVKHES